MPPDCYDLRMTQDALTSPPQRTWGEAARAFLHPRVISMLFFGFSAGLPFYLIFGTLSVWLTEAGTERSTVTFFSWAMLAFSFKFIWAPLIDRLPVPFLTARLGRRRAWMLTAQISVVIALLWMAFSEPSANLVMTALGAVLLGFSAATQDIALDAFRIEAVDEDLQALMSSTYVAGYRAGMLLSGAGALKMASYFGSTEDAYLASAWTWSYACMAAAMLVGVVATLVVKEPDARIAGRDERTFSARHHFHLLAFFIAAAGTFILTFSTSAGAAESLQEMLRASLPKHLAGFLAQSLRLGVAIGAAALLSWALTKTKIVPREVVKTTYVDPITDFLERYGKAAVLVLILVATYRIADIVLGTISNVFYIELGFTKDQIANIAKTFGLFMTLFGGFLGGLFSVKFGVLRTLFLGAALAAVTNLLFAWLAIVGPEPWALILVISADNLAMGLSTATFVAYLSSLTSVSFTATQYALFSSIMTLFPKILGGYSGMIVDVIGYPAFFVGTAIIGLPVLVLIQVIGRLEKTL